MGLKELLILLDDTQTDLEVVLKALAEARSKGKHGTQDIMSKRASMIRSKITYYQNKILGLGQGNILHISFKVIEENNFKVPKEFVHYYINITKEEGETLLNYWAATKGYKIQILEIKDISTQKSYCKL